MNELRSSPQRKVITSASLDPALIARLDAWRAALRVRMIGGAELDPPSRSAAIELAIREFLSRQDSHSSATATGTECPGA